VYLRCGVCEMKKQRKSLFLGCIAILLSLSVASAAPKPKKPKQKPQPPTPPIGSVVGGGDTFDAKVVVNKLEKTIQCYKEAPGFIQANGDGTTSFITYQDQVTYLKKRQKIKRLSPKAKKKIKKEQLGFVDLIKAAGSECSNPPFLELDPYTGTFGVAEARLLLERFAFGASPAQVNEAVAAGLNATIARLTTSVPESSIGLDAVENDMRCDGYLIGHPVDDQKGCTPGNINDLSDEGVRLGIYTRIVLSPNSFFHKLFMFLHDERMAVSQQAATSYEKYSTIRHVEMLRRAAFSGDYRQFMREWNEDLLGHLKWLDGASNKGSSPNENYAREFWELGTTGPTDLEGKAVYSDRDLAQSALAFSGWIVDSDSELDGLGKEYRIDVKAYAPDRHASGSFTIFGGTPWQASVVNGEDVLRATLAHPRTAEHLAEDIWKEFINPWATPTAIRALAKKIRDSDYNLLPVFRIVMKSRALYNSKSRKSLIKHPIELVFGYLKSFPGYPVYRWENSSEWQQYDDYLDTMGQRPMLPSSVFGWNEKQLAGEAFVLGWREVVTLMLGQDKDDYTELKYDFFQSMSSGVLTSGDMLSRISDALNVQLSAGQLQALDDFMNFQRRTCQSWSNNDLCKAGAISYLEREIFDPNPLNMDWESGLYKMQGAMAIMMMLPDYRMK